MRHAIIIAGLGLSAVCVQVQVQSAEPMAVPLCDLDFYRQYESVRRDNSALVFLAQSTGGFQLFHRIHDEGSAPSWWAFYVDPGQYDDLRVQLVTTKGTYTSDEVRFVPWKQREIYRCPITVDDSFESEIVNGKRRVIAYAHFPTEPKGDLVSWSQGGSPSER